MVNRRFLIFGRFFVTITLAVLTGEGSGRVIRVPDDYEQIHVAEEFAGRGDTVLVSPGTYEENVRIRSIDFVIGSLLLTTGDPRYIDETIIDGSGSGSPVVRADGGDAGSPLLRGFTIVGGMTDYGGGIICRDSTRPVFEDLKIVGNQAEYLGGGAYIYRGAAATFRRVLFENNSSEAGGAVAEYSSSNSYQYCAFVNNRASSGGGIYSYGSYPTLVNCRLIRNNLANLAFLYSHPELLRVVIDNGGFGAEAVMLRGSREGLETTFDRVTLISSGIQDGVLIRVISSQGDYALPGFRLINSIVRGSSNRLLSIGDGVLETAAFVDYCNIEGGREAINLNRRASLEYGDHNFDSNPRFIDDENGEFRLEEESPCIDAGDENGLPDPDNSRADLGGFPLGGFSAPLIVRVSDSRSGEPIESAEVVIRQEESEFILGTTNANGICADIAFHQTLFWSEVEVITRREHCRNGTGQAFLGSGYIASTAIEMEVEPFALTQEEFEVELDPPDSVEIGFSLQSRSLLPVVWDFTIGDSVGNQEYYNDYVRIEPPRGMLAPGENQLLRLKISTEEQHWGRAITSGNHLVLLRMEVEDYHYDEILPLRIRVPDLEVGGIEKADTPQGNFEVFPIPFNSFVTVIFDMPVTGLGYVELFDTRGGSIRSVRLSEGNMGRSQVDVSTDDLPAGEYLLRVRAPGMVKVKKIVSLK